MSPEQARGEPLDERSDVYSLSVMFHEMLGLQHYLHHATTLQSMLLGVQTYKPPAVAFVASRHQSGAPMDLAHFVNKGLAKDPAQRFQSVQEMIDRLRARAAGDIPIECPITFVKSATSRWTRFVDKHPFLVMGGLSASVLAVCGAVGWSIVHAM
jgi:eukaryotic-like serine/threonine-protein kinase